MELMGDPLGSELSNRSGVVVLVQHHRDDSACAHVYCSAL